MSDTNDKKKVQVSFSEDQWQTIQQVGSSFGSTDAETVRNIVIAWLAEKSFISEYNKNKGKGGNHE